MLPAAGIAAPAKAQVYLVQGEGLKAVDRQLANRTVAASVGSLLEGPTAAEAGSVPRISRRSRLSGLTGLRPVPRDDAPAVYSFAALQTPVKVLR